jgi:hypothetical protein
VCSGATLERWYRDEIRRQPKLLLLTRDELMRHEAAGITTASFPKTLRLGGVDCTASYLHEPGDAKDGITVTVPIYALNQVSDERCEWLVPGMLKDKVLALVKTLHQRPRSRLVPLPEYAETFIAAINDAQPGARVPNTTNSKSTATRASSPVTHSAPPSKLESRNGMMLKLKNMFIHSRTSFRRVYPLSPATRSSCSTSSVEIRWVAPKINPSTYGYGPVYFVMSSTNPRRIARKLHKYSFFGFPSSQLATRFVIQLPKLRNQ